MPPWALELVVGGRGRRLCDGARGGPGADGRCRGAQAHGRAQAQPQGARRAQPGAHQRRVGHGARVPPRQRGHVRDAPGGQVPPLELVGQLLAIVVDQVAIVAQIILKNKKKRQPK